MYFNFNLKNVFSPDTVSSLLPVAANLQDFSFAFNICHFNWFGHWNEIARCAFFFYKVQGKIIRFRKSGYY